MVDQIEDLMMRLEIASVAACTCETKTHEIQHHQGNCRYRVMQEAADKIENLSAAVMDLLSACESCCEVQQVVDPHSMRHAYEALGKIDEFTQYGPLHRRGVFVKEKH